MNSRFPISVLDEVPGVRGRDWSRLLPELLKEIAVRLPELSDHIHFRAVCSAWRAISIPLFHQNCPYIFLHPYDSKDSHCQLLNPSDDRVHNLRLPNFCPNQRIFGSSFGCVLIVDLRKSTITLLNPFTRSLIQLPPLITEQGEAIVLRSADDCQGKLIKSQHGFSVVVCFSSNRFYSGSPFLIHCQPGDSAWKTIHQSVYEGVWMDFTLYNGKVCFLDAFKGTAITDPTDPAYRRMIPNQLPYDEMEHNSYFVESSSGELLMVARFSYYNDIPKMRPQKFEVFQLDDSEQQPRWFKITSIGDDVLFLDDENAMCFTASKFEGCRANCIYFWDNHRKNEFDVKDRISLFNIREDRIENLLLCWGSNSLFDFREATMPYGRDEMLHSLDGMPHSLDDMLDCLGDLLQMGRSRGVWIVPKL